MKRSDWIWATLAAGLAAFIWLRDLHWRAAAGDVLPILVGFPLMVWFGAPWRFQASNSPIRIWAAGLAAILFLTGIVLDLTFVLALAWCWLVWIWLASRVPEREWPTKQKTLALGFLSFPWIALDGQPIGWAFRWSAAWIAAHLFKALGVSVQWQGTSLSVRGEAIAIEPACAGLNALQSVLLAGAAMALVFLGGRRRFWWNLPFLAGLAWLANTLRIVALCCAAVWISPAFFRGALHQASGLAVVALMFFVCWPVMRWQSAK